MAIDSGNGTEGVALEHIQHIYPKEDRIFHYYYAPESYAQWISISILLASFGAVIANTANGNEPRVSTFLVVLGIAFLVWSTPMYFLTHWRSRNRILLGFLIVLLIGLLAAYCWLISKFWT